MQSVASTKSAGKGGRTTPTPGAKKKKGAGASKADADDDKVRHFYPYFSISSLFKTNFLRHMY